MSIKSIQSAGISKRLEEVLDILSEKGFRCLSTGKLCLPSHTNIEAWVNGRLLIYLVYDSNTGGWDIISSIDNTNSIEAT